MALKLIYRFSLNYYRVCLIFSATLINFLLNLFGISSHLTLLLFLILLTIVLGIFLPSLYFLYSKDESDLGYPFKFMVCLPLLVTLFWASKVVSKFIENLSTTTFNEYSLIILLLPILFMISNIVLLIRLFRKEKV